MVRFEQDPGNPGHCHALRESGPVPLAVYLAGHDIVVNCVLQDTEAPLMFVTSADLDAFTPGSPIVEVSCDRGMGFSWARPTSFSQPMLTVGNNVRYYGVDHSPSHLWDSATWEISEALLPYLRPVLAGPAAGTRTRPSGGRSRSETVSSRPASCPSSTARRTIRTCRGPRTHWSPIILSRGRARRRRQTRG